MSRLAAACTLMVITACHSAAPPEGDLAFGIAIDGAPTRERLAEFTSSCGLKPRLVVVFSSWPASPSSEFVSPSEAVRTIADAGAIPVLTWEPWRLVPGNAEPAVIPAEAILDKSWNTYIDAWLAALRDTGAQVWVRFAHEMNTSRYHWGVATAGDFGPEAPFIYRRLFRFVVDRARALGAGNVRWVFCPNAESVPLASGKSDWNKAARYYPGDDYVDILGMDGYNWGDSVKTLSWTSRQQSFAGIFAPLQKELRALAPAKPLVVFESASVSTGVDKSAWICDAIRTALAWRLTGFVWFDVSKENDWRFVPGASASAIAFIDEHDDPSPWPPAGLRTQLSPDAAGRPSR